MSERAFGKVSGKVSGRMVGSVVDTPPLADGPVGPGEALDRLREAVELLAGADLDRLSDRQLLEHTVGVDEALTRLDAQRVRRLAAVDRRAAFGQEACVTVGSWWKLRTRRDGPSGTRMTRRVRRLARFERLREAFEAGRVTAEHVEVFLPSQEMPSELGRHIHVVQSRTTP